MLGLLAHKGGNVPRRLSCYACMSSRRSYISFLLLQATQMILCQFYSHHDIMGKDCCDKNVHKNNLPCNEYYLFNCQAKECNVDCCKDDATRKDCVKNNTLIHLLTELAPTPVGHGCCVPSFPPMIQYNAKRHCERPGKFGPFASSNLRACENQGAFDCQRAPMAAGRVCPCPNPQKRIDYRGDSSASGHLRMAKLQAVAWATGPLRSTNCVGGCNTTHPARSYPEIGGPTVVVKPKGGGTPTYCPQRFANQQRTSQFLLASSFSAL